ncbi:MAG: hypothetical protein AAF202_11985 [Pseudomonadota bacterium]
MKSLVRFGRMAPIGFGILGALIAWRSGVVEGDWPWIIPLCVWSTGASIFSVSFIRPRWLLPIYQLLFGLGWLFLTAIGYLAMSLIFFLVLTPVALVFQIIHRDALHRKSEATAQSYWLPLVGDQPSESYYRQY